MTCWIRMGRAFHVPIVLRKRKGRFVEKGAAVEGAVAFGTVS